MSQIYKKVSLNKFQNYAFLSRILTSKQVIKRKQIDNKCSIPPDNG